jgi:hypothetical protein
MDILQCAAVVPVGQLLPGASETVVPVIILLPRSAAAFTVVVPVMKTLPPTGMLPVHLIPVPVMTSSPELAVWLPSLMMSSNASPPLLVTTMLS